MSGVLKDGGKCIGSGPLNRRTRKRARPAKRKTKRKTRLVPWEKLSEQERAAWARAIKSLYTGLKVPA